MKDEGSGTRRGEGLDLTRRRYLVIEGVYWTVRLVASNYDRRRPDLVFESDSLVRRVRNYPDDWHTLADVELLALSERL